MKKPDVFGSRKKPLPVGINRRTLENPLIVTTSRIWPDMRGYKDGDDFYLRDSITLTVFRGEVTEVNDDPKTIRIVFPVQ